MKIAIIHDDLMRRGGAEQVVLSMMKAFPQANLYTLCYNPELTYPEFKNYAIRTSKFNKFISSERGMKRFFFPFGLLFMMAMKVKGYDTVLISNTYCAKYVNIVNPKAVVIYTYTPFRLAWNPNSYAEYNNSRCIKRLIFNFVINILKRIDLKSAKKGTHFLSMTEETAERVRKAYEVSEVGIIHPPVKCHNFHVSKSIEDYYLIVSRLEFYKNVHLAIKAFNILNLRLIIVGNGSKREELISMAGKSIEFKSGLGKDELAALYSKCKALIFPQYEDYGITPLEANASGRPVVAYGQGGVLETMIPLKESNKDFTAIFFKEQTVDSLIEGISILEENISRVNSEFIRNHATKFDEQVFLKKLKDFVAENVHQHSRISE